MSTKKTKEDKPQGLDLMRVPFTPNQIGRLPKPTRKQTEAVKSNYKNGIRCGECGGWHHPDVVHLDYVGHAALTDRLLDCDDSWQWEPVSFNERGLPALDDAGGLWIRLTVCGVTRLGYGHADGKRGGDAVKEAIGDALRNAAMRFGAALDLWHKGDLHNAADDTDAADQHDRVENADPRRAEVKKLVQDLKAFDTERGSIAELDVIYNTRQSLMVDLYKDKPDTHAAIVDLYIRIKDAIRATASGHETGGTDCPFDDAA